MSDFSNWLVDLVKSIFSAVWDFIIDIVVSLVESVLHAILSLISAIPVPAFARDGLSSAFSAIPPEVWFFAGHFRLGECFAILGSAVTFRLARKAVTLFQW